MAAYLFRDMIQDSHPDWRVSSAGVAASYGIPASKYAIEALTEVGVDLRSHRSQPVIPQMVATASLFIVMTNKHLAYLRDTYPAIEEKAHTLLSLNPEAREPDLLDPIGLSLDVYRHVRDEIQNALPGVLQLVERIS
jgi:protein-tyrosine phosphatase